MTKPDLDVQLPRSSRAPEIARHRLTAWIPGTFEQPDVERARLLVSELVTNAVVHGKGKITLRAAVADGRMIVDVIDHGDGFEGKARARSFDEISPRGHGLDIVDTEASRWGLHEGTTHVWFELEPSGPRLGPDENPLS